MRQLRLHNPNLDGSNTEPVVITGIGLNTALGLDRETVWQRVRAGHNGVQSLDGTSTPSFLKIGAPVEIPGFDSNRSLKVVQLAELAAKEALADSKLDTEQTEPTRIGCAVSAHVGDLRWWSESSNPAGPTDDPRLNQWFPNTACWHVATKLNLMGPRICHSTACASGLIDVLSASRSIQSGECDIAVAGSAEAIDPVFAAGFNRMRVLATHENPEEACRPFDADRTGFVMGEGAAMFVLERRDHAIARGAKIYAEFVAGKMLADAEHITSLDRQSEGLTRLITDVLRRGNLEPKDIEYINAHGTGTEQNDIVEVRGIRQAFGFHADRLSISSNKAMLGHLVNAAGSVELALTTLALRDGFLPPTLNLTNPDPECDLDCLPLIGRKNRCQHAMKLSIAFGGHLVGVVLRRWNEAATGFAYPDVAKAA